MTLSACSTFSPVGGDKYHFDCESVNHSSAVNHSNSDTECARRADTFA